LKLNKGKREWSRVGLVGKAGQKKRKKHEPGVGNWELVGGADLLNAKSPGTIASMKILEPVDGNTRGAGHKLEQSGLLLVVKTLNSLEGGGKETVNNLFRGTWSSRASKFSPSRRA